VPRTHAGALSVRQRMGRSMCAWPRGTARSTHSPAPRSRC